MSWQAVAIAGSAIIGGVVQGNAAEDAADAVAQGNQAGIAETRRQFDTVLGLQRPYMVTGTGALNKLARLYGLPYQEYADPAGYGAGGYGGATSGTVGRTGFGDPLDGLPDPLGLFGNSGRSATWAPGEGSTFTARQVSRMLKQGMTLEQIDSLGRLETSLNPRRIKKLLKRGLTVDEIKRLQYGEEGADGPDKPEIITPDGPDMSEFIESPDYQFNLSENLEAVDRSAAARSGALSGNAAIASQQRGSQLASGEFAGFFNRLATLAGIGQSSTTVTSGAADNTGRVVSSLLADTGQARASGVLGQGQAVNDAIGGGLSAWLLHQGGYFDKPAVA